MSDFTTPEDLMDDLFDSQYDPDNRVEPDAGSYGVKVIFAEMKPRGPVGQNNTILGARYSIGLQITKGQHQENGSDPTGKTFFTDVFVPGGDWLSPEFKPRGKLTTAAEVRTADMKSFRSFLDGLGWTAEHGTGFKSDAKVFMGIEAEVKVTYKAKDPQSEPRMYVNWKKQSA
jgi:hypothetical protein